MEQNGTKLNLTFDDLKKICINILANKSSRFSTFSREMNEEAENLWRKFELSINKGEVNGASYKYPNFKTILSSINMVTSFDANLCYDWDIAILAFVFSFFEVLGLIPNYWFKMKVESSLYWSQYFSGRLFDFYKIHYSINPPNASLLINNLSYDMSLARLAFPWEVFIENQRKLTFKQNREELGKYFENKRQIFECLINRRHIFSSMTFVNNYDNIARENLVKYINLIWNNPEITGKEAEKHIEIVEVDRIFQNNRDTQSNNKNKTFKNSGNREEVKENELDSTVILGMS